MSTRILFANSFTVMIDEDQSGGLNPRVGSGSHAPLNASCVRNNSEGRVRTAFCFLPKENAPTGRSQCSCHRIGIGFTVAAVPIKTLRTVRGCSYWEGFQSR